MTCYLEGREDPCQCWPPCLGHEHEAVLVHSRDRRKWLRCACAKPPAHATDLRVRIADSEL